MWHMITNFSSSAHCLGSAIVTDVTPRHIGWRGGAVTIHGSGFSEDVFNQFDPVLGNKVKAELESRMFLTGTF